MPVLRPGAVLAECALDMLEVRLMTDETTKAYWVDLPWASYREQTGYTPEEALTKAEIARDREIARLKREMEWVRTVKLEVQSDEE